MSMYYCESCHTTHDDDYMPMSDFGTCCKLSVPICSECGDECEIVEESFDYAGTHCNHGKSGTHYTGRYVSKCCLAELKED